MVGPRESAGGLPEPQPADWSGMLGSVKAMTAVLTSTIEDAQQLLLEDAALVDQENEREWNAKPLLRPGVKARPEFGLGYTERHMLVLAVSSYTHRVYTASGSRPRAPQVTALTVTMLSRPGSAGLSFPLVVKAGRFPCTYRQRSIRRSSAGWPRRRRAACPARRGGGGGSAPWTACPARGGAWRPWAAGWPRCAASPAGGRRRWTRRTPGARPVHQVRVQVFCTVGRWARGWRAGGTGASAAAPDTAQVWGPKLAELKHG